MYSDNISFEDKFAPHADEFFSKFSVGALFRKAGASKIRGVKVVTVLRYLFFLAFTPYTMARDQAANGNAVKKDTCHRLLSMQKIDWNCFLGLVASSIARLLEPLRRKNCKGRLYGGMYILDDSSFYRDRSKKTELLAKCWDHALNVCFKGFRMLTLAWCDGATTLPVSFCNMSSENRKSRVTEASASPEGSFGEKIKGIAQTKMNEAAIELIREARKNGPKATKLLCDRWFSAPKMIFAFTREGLDVITMLKQNKTKYVFEGKELTVKQIFRILLERDRIQRRKDKTNGKLKGRSWQFHVTATIYERDGEERKDVTLTYVRNRNKKSEFLVILSTDTSLSAEEVVECFGHRWNIEVMFKTLKSHLRLQKSTQSIDYMQIHGSTAIAMLQFQMLAYIKRMENDEASFGELFLLLVEEVTDEAFYAALSAILSIFATKVSEKFSIPEEKMKEMLDEFLSALPSDIKRFLIQEKKTNKVA